MLAEVEGSFFLHASSGKDVEWESTGSETVCALSHWLSKVGWGFGITVCLTTWS